METRVKAVMAKVFGVEAGSIKEDASPDNIKKWDSLGHMNLVIALEKEFGVEFDGDKIIYMMNYKLILQVLSEMIKDKK